MAKEKTQAVSSEETTSQQLFSHLFEACNILRGPINQDEYKSYVTPILFFKRISDVYDEETQIALEESDGDGRNRRGRMAAYRRYGLYERS